MWRLATVKVIIININKNNIIVKVIVLFTWRLELGTWLSSGFCLRSVQKNRFLEIYMFFLNRRGLCWTAQDGSATQLSTQLRRMLR